MQFNTVLVAKTPRVNCPKCGVKTAFLPWANKHSQFTLLFEAFAIEVLQIAKSIKGIVTEKAKQSLKKHFEEGVFPKKTGHYSG